MSSLPDIVMNEDNDGLMLAGSLLCFDALQHGSISFLSSASIAKSKPSVQIICTEQTNKILEILNKKSDALVCQYNRPFSLGDLKLELLPSGTVLGGASLFIETSNMGRILYAPYLQTKHIPLVRKFQLKKSEVLIIGAFHPSSSGTSPSRKKEVQKLITEIEKVLKLGHSPTLVCRPFGTAQEMTKFINEHDLPLAVGHQIYKINKIYENYGSALGKFSLYNFRQKKPKVNILSPNSWHLATRKGRVKPQYTYYIDDVLNPIHTGLKLKTVATSFNIGSISSGQEIKEVIAAVQPKVVYLFGPYAKSYADDLGKQKYQVKVLFKDSQPTLL